MPETEILLFQTSLLLLLLAHTSISDIVHTPFLLTISYGVSNIVLHYLQRFWAACEIPKPNCRIQLLATRSPLAPWMTSSALKEATIRGGHWMLQLILAFRFSVEFLRFQLDCVGFYSLPGFSIVVAAVGHSLYVQVNKMRDARSIYWSSRS